MSKRANPTAIGAFVVGALVLVVIGLITLGGLELFKKELPFVMFFDGSIGGLDLGAPVEIRGVRIGAVTKIRLFADSTKIGVYVNIDPTLLPKGGAVRRGGVDAVKGMIQRGLRAQLKTQSLLTGQLLVYLDFFPDTPITLVRLDPDVLEIPTVPTTLEQLQARIENLLDKLGTVKIDELIRDVSLTLKSAKDLMSSPELKTAIISADTTLRSANRAIQDAQVVLKRLDAKLDTVGTNTDATLVEMRGLLVEARKSLAKIDAQVEPLAASIRDASTSAQGTLRTVDKAVDGDSRMGYEAVRALRDVGDAARSLKALADYLERHPEALLRGKGGPESK
jgi:phospholipid/cholesterol/gamma-HCH transport system substrate-binding protein